MYSIGRLDGHQYWNDDSATYPIAPHTDGTVAYSRHVLLMSSGATTAERLGEAAPFGVAVRCDRATVQRCDISGSAVAWMRRLTSVARPHSHQRAILYACACLK